VLILVSVLGREVQKAPTPAKKVGPHTGLQEGDTVEFKEKWVEAAMYDIAAFANTRGGTVHLGVNKAGHAVEGCDVSDQAQQDIATKVANVLGLIADIRVRQYDDIPTLEITVRKSARPIQLRGAYYYRSGSTTISAKDEDWGRLVLAQLGLAWDGLPADADVEEDIDAERVRAFVRSARGRERPRISDQVRDTDPVELILGNLGLLKEDRPTNAALLVFGREPQKRCRAARISIAYFRSLNDFDPYPDLGGTVFEQIDGALRIIEQVYPARVTFDRNEAEDVVRRTQRRETPSFPILAVKEAVTNAVVHRDYTRVGAEVQIRMYPDRLVIMNPGGLMPGLTIEQLREDPHRSEKRNPLIAEVCFMDYWVERYGTGTTRMIQQCQAAGLPEPEFRADPDGFSVTFRRDALTPDLLQRKGLNERQVRAVLHVKEHGQITSSTYQELTGVSRRTATNDLGELSDRGLLRKIGGRGRGTHYVLAEHSAG